MREKSRRGLTCSSPLGSHLALLLTTALVLFPRPLGADAERGAVLFERECAVCHGPNGKGDGPATPLLDPKARNFTPGLFKLRMTATGELPTDEDLIKTITRGMPGTGMPSFAELGNDSVSDLADFVKTLGGPEGEEGSWFELYEVPDPISVPASPPRTAATIAEGAKLYVSMGCDTCHGKTGEGDGKPPEELLDNWGDPVPSTNFVMGIYKGGHGPKDLYARIMTGMDGSPMTSFWKDALTPNERWSVVDYVTSFGEPQAVRQPSKGALQLFEGRAPSNINDAAWQYIPSNQVPQMALKGGWMGRFPPLRAQVVAEAERLSLRVELKDDTAGSWRALKIVFHEGATAPIFGLGSPEEPLLVWSWSKDNGAETFSASGSAALAPSPLEYPVRAEIGSEGKSILLVGPRAARARSVLFIVEGEKEGMPWVTSSTFRAFADASEGD